MPGRYWMRALLLASLVLPFVGCGSSTSIDSIAVTPTTLNLGVGATAQLTAIGTIGHGVHPSGTQNITNTATWASSIAGVATVSSTGVVTAIAPGTTTITASIQGFGGTITSNAASVTVPTTTLSEPLVSLAIDPTAGTANAINQTGQFIAIATTSTGATVNLTNQSATVNGSLIRPAVWSSSNTAVATINSATGLATALSAGTTTITAIVSNPDGTVVTSTSKFTVTISGSPEPLVSLAIVPATQTASAVGQTAQYIAIGTTGSGTTVNLTNQPATINGATVAAAVWSSSNASAATIGSATGLATARGAGVTAITAIATNPDGSVVTGTATYTVTIPASPEPLVSLAIVPAAQTATAAGQTAQYIAIGTTSSGTTVNLTNQSATIGTATIQPAVWNSSSASTATINAATGLATAKGAGATVITAIASNPDGSVVTATATYTVSIATVQESLVSLAIIPASQTATVANQTAQFIAIGTTSSGTTVNLTNKPAVINGVTIPAATWTSSTVSVATINANTGLATALSTGTSAITAIAANPDGSVVTGVATFTVTTTGVQEPLLSLAIVPNTQSVTSPGQTSQLLAIGTFSAVPFTQNLTTNNTTYPIRWSSSDTSVATVGSPEKAGTTPGLVTATGQGTASITAYAANPDGTLVYAIANFNVTGGTAEPYTAISIVPSSLTLSATGQTGQFIALGTLGSNGLNQDVSNSSQVTWSSSISTIATVSTYPAIPAGVAAGVSAGNTTITAKLTNPDGSVLTANATVTVVATAAPEPLLSITVLPTSITDNNLYGTGQFLAYGTFSTAPTVQDITNGVNHNGFTSPVTWVSTSPFIFPIESGGAPGATGGLVTADGSGTDDIYVVATNPDGTLVYSPPVTFNCPLVLASTDPETGAITPGSCNTDTIAPTVLVNLTVFNAGLNQTGWLITAPSATGTADVIHCGPGSTAGGSVCSATYPVNTTITLTAPAEPGVNFGGWSYNCAEQGTVTAAGPNTCTVTLGTDSSSNVTVGAVFN